MIVNVKLFATLRNGREMESLLFLPEGSAIRDILEKLDIGEKDASIALRNGRRVPFDCIVDDNDTVSIFPPVGGG